VQNFLNGYRQTEEFMQQRLTRMMGFLLPLYREEGKTALVVALGCTGGHHRSGGP
jgi:UPF0042 nucleotide-binding protein